MKIYKKLIHSASVPSPPARAAAKENQKDAQNERAGMEQGENVDVWLTSVWTDVKENQSEPGSENQTLTIDTDQTQTLQVWACGET